MSFLITTLLLLLGCGAVIWQINASEPSYRLSRHVRPMAYDIWLKPYLLAGDEARRFTFDGEVNITFFINSAEVREIALHKSLINITGASLYNKRHVLLRSFSSEELTYEETTQKLTVNLNYQLALKTKYTLRFVYTGQIQDGPQGFTVFGIIGAVIYSNTRWIGVAQSMPIGARSIFPCFDEPAFKAKFRLNMSRPTEYNTVFNTKLLKSTPDGVNRYLDRFAATPIMPTYLFTFVVSELPTFGNDDFKLITVREYQYFTHLAHKMAEQAITGFVEYTRKSKSSNIRNNGMHSWFLITDGHNVLVNIPGKSDGWSNTEQTLIVIVHDIAHMWFGDSVTFGWWSYLWLNEAFACYYQYFMANKLYPGYQLDQQFVVKQMHFILEIDATNSTQPMTSPPESINSPAEIGYKFSSITCAKGASVLRMIANLMGVNNFDDAIRNYLKKYHLKNTHPEHLFRYFKLHWPISTQPDLDMFFADWTEKVGYPVVLVNASIEGEVKISQKRFLLDPYDGSDGTLTYLIPITYTTDFEANFDNLTTRFYLIHYEISIVTEKPYKWILFNLQQSNYYRVFYDNVTLLQLKKALVAPNHSGIPPTNRAQLVDDLFNFARAGMLDYVDVFEFVEYMAYETEYLPWYALFSNLQHVAQRLTLHQVPALEVYLRNIMPRVYMHLGFTRINDTVLDIYNRNQVISWACKYFMSKCAEEVVQFYRASKAANVKTPPDFRETLYCSVMREDYTMFHDILDALENENLVSEIQKLIRALSCTLMFRRVVYNRALYGAIPSKYVSMAVKALYEQNPESREPVFILITHSIERLAYKVGGWSNAANLIKDIANHLTTRRQKQLLVDFVAENGTLFGPSIATLHVAIENVESNLEWARRRLPRLIEYLERV